MKTVRAKLLERVLWAGVLAIACVPVLAASQETEPSWYEEALHNVWNWILLGLLELGSLVLGWVIETLPQNYVPNLAAVQGYFTTANAFIPIDLGISLFVAYYAFVGAFVLVKFILKLIPTIG